MAPFYAGPDRGSGQRGGVARAYARHPATPAMRLPWSSVFLAESPTRMDTMAAVPAAATRASRGEAARAGAPAVAVPAQKMASPSRLGCLQMR